MPEKTSQKPIGYIISERGHSFPLSRLTIDAIKHGCKRRKPKQGLHHKQSLTVVTRMLGFPGDSGDYSKKHFPFIEQLLADHNCKKQGGLFPRHYGGCIDLGLTAFRIKERDLSDRLFLSGKPWPKKVFLGYGVDWSVWDRGDGQHPPEAAIKTIGGDPQTAAERAEILWEYRAELLEDWNFHGDALFGETYASEIPYLYQSNGPEGDKRMRAHIKRATDRRKAFYDIFAEQSQGWVEIIKVTDSDSLAILKGCDGTWQPLWKGFRDTAPPDIEGTGVHCLSLIHI